MDTQNTVLVQGASLNDSKAESELSEEVLALQKREIEFFKLQRVTYLHTYIHTYIRIYIYAYIHKRTYTDVYATPTDLLGGKFMTQNPPCMMLYVAGYFVE